MNCKVTWKLHVWLSNNDWDPCGRGGSDYEVQTFLDEERALQVLGEIKKSGHVGNRYVSFANLESVITTQVDEYRH